MKVSVHMVTYNHEKFIAQAIEGVLMQETDFPYELVIGEDCSTDGTREIVIDYAQRCPNKIRALLREKNLGMRENGRRTREACRGEYIALCEGDDYWTDPHKLQKQVDFLDTHPRYAFAFHNVYVEREDGTRDIEPYLVDVQQFTFGLADVLITNPVPTCSVIYRRLWVGDLPTWYYTLDTGDHPLYLLLAQKGPLFYLDEVMGVYRKHQGGVYTSRSYDQRFDGLLRMYEAFSDHLGPHYDSIIREAKSNYTAELVVEKARAAGGPEEGLAVVRRTLAKWQEEYTLPDAWLTRALGRACAYYVFTTRTEHIARRTARHCLVQMIRNDPSWLRNPGVLSIAADLLLGEQYADRLRGHYRRLSRQLQRGET